MNKIFKRLIGCTVRFISFLLGTFIFVGFLEGLSRGEELNFGTRQDCAIGSNVSSELNVDIDLELSPLEYDRSLNLSQIKKKIDLSKKEVDGAHGFFEPHIRFQSNFRIHTADPVSSTNRKYCVWVDRINITVSSRNSIFIANEYAPGSCRYNEILRHETQHYEDFIESGEKIFGPAEHTFISAGFPTVEHPLVVSDAETGEKQIKAMFTDILKNLREEFQLELGEKAQEFHEMEEDKTQFASCGGQ